MLKQRIITALVLLAFLLPAMWADSVWPFAALLLLMMAAAGWEWGRLNGLASNPAVAFGMLIAALCAMGAAAQWVGRAPPVLWWFASLAWILGGGLALKKGVAGWPQLPRIARLGMGVVILFTAWLALASAKQKGLAFTLSVFCLVWVADIAAYAGGKAFGRRKLAPSISPGKSWEGAISGLLGVWVLALVWRVIETHPGAWPPADSASLYLLISERVGLWGMLAALAVLSAMSVVGDLVESLMKRAAGMKDSSGLLPGHGGVLDRVDALLPVFPLAMALACA